jgi:hypothetical protein
MVSILTGTCVKLKFLDLAMLATRASSPRKMQ